MCTPNIRSSFCSFPCVVLCFFETHLMPKIRLLDPNRKKNRCHFRFCITPPAVGAVIVSLCILLITGHSSPLLLLKHPSIITPPVPPISPFKLKYRRLLCSSFLLFGFPFFNFFLGFVGSNNEEKNQQVDSL